MPVRYSKQTERSGVTIGTVVSIPKPITWSNSTNLTTETNNWGVETNYPGWLPCDGRSLNISEYKVLYDVIGNTYGGTATTFNLPDYRSKKLMGTGPVSRGTVLTLTPIVGPGTTTAAPDVPGSIGGLYTLTTTRQLPPTSEITPGSPANPAVIGGSATDTFSLGSYSTNGFSATTGSVNANINGNVTYNIGPVSQKSLGGVAPHSHAVVYVQATGGTMAIGSPYCAGQAYPFLNNVEAGVRQFQREGRTLLRHSHYLYFESEANDALGSYGLDDGAGSSGLVNSSYTVTGPLAGPAFATNYSSTNNRGTTITKTLSMGTLGVAINDATVTLTSTAKASWDASLNVRLQAAEELPLMSAYYRLKYIIKAY